MANDEWRMVNDEWRALLNLDMKFVGAIPCGCPYPSKGRHKALPLPMKLMSAFSNAEWRMLFFI
ncbi:hypothetical protein [Sivoneniella epilithica]